MSKVLSWVWRWSPRCQRPAGHIFWDRRLGQEGDPEGIPASTTDSGHLFVVDQVSINAVTILAPVSIFGKALHGVVDSGAEVSILSSREYHALPEEVRPVLQPSSVRLMVADRSQRLSAKGVVLLEFTIVELRVWVASLCGSDRR